MDGWTRSEILGLMALIVALIGALAAILVIQSKVWRIALIVCIIAVTMITGAILIVQNLTKEQFPASSDEAIKKEYVRKNIVGEWYNPDARGNPIFEFTDIGNVTVIKDHYGPDKENGTYKILDSEHLELTTPSYAKEIFLVELRQDILKLTQVSRDKIMGYRRVPFYLRLGIFLEKLIKESF